MDLNAHIEGLNKKKEIQKLGLPVFDNTHFTDEENTFLQTFQPQKHLIIYGSLAPGAPNHNIVEHIKGEWKKGIVKGHLEAKGWGADMGYLAFRHIPIEQQKDIKAHILISDELVLNW